MEMDSKKLALFRTTHAWRYVAYKIGDIRKVNGATS